MTRPRKPKLLIIEDDRMLSRLMIKRFTQEGFQVEWAKNGEEGLKKNARFHPDLIILDIMMPKKDGVAVFKEITNKQKTPIIIWSNIDADEAYSALGKRGVHFIPKAEFSMEGLISEVHRRLKK